MIGLPDPDMYAVGVELWVSGFLAGIATVALIAFAACACGLRIRRIR